MMKDTFTLLGGFLQPFFSFWEQLGFRLNGIPEASINAFVFASAAFVALVINLYCVWKNTHISKKAQLQKKALQAQGLMKK